MIDNERIRPTILVSEDLAPNPAVMHFPMAALNLLPPAVHHTLVCLSLNHYIHSLPFGADKIIAAGNRSKIYHHRGAAIRALSEYVGKDQTQCNDLSISSILVFMSMEVRCYHISCACSETLRQLIDYFTATKPAHGRLALPRRRPQPPDRNARRIQGTTQTITLPLLYIEYVRPASAPLHAECIPLTD
jgi:hypothetical protein